VPEAVGWATRTPHPSLRHLVARYLGYTQHDVTLDIHRGLPSRYLTLIISLDRPIRVTGMPTPGEAPANLQALVGGLHTGPVLIAQDRFQSGIHVELNPLGARALLGVSAADLSGHVVGLEDLGPPRFETLVPRLAGVPDWPARFAILDDVFASAVADAASPLPEVGWAWRRMVRAGGKVRVASLADEVGWSRRHFGEKFRAEVGISPKQAARVLRFERAGSMLRRGGPVDLASLALGCGYYDQAHLTNEWRTLAGCSPGTWIAEELPFLQDDRTLTAED
jgi:AraC-like DNA-binding protein